MEISKEEFSLLFFCNDMGYNKNENGDLDETK